MFFVFVIVIVIITIINHYFMKLPTELEAIIGNHCDKYGLLCYLNNLIDRYNSRKCLDSTLNKYSDYWKYGFGEIRVNNKTSFLYILSCMLIIFFCF